MARPAPTSAPSARSETRAPTGTDAFISYSRKDREFVQELHDALTAHGKDVWADWEDIPPTAEWRVRIRDGIESANAIVFVLSPDSAASVECDAELELALAANKRIVPLVHREVDPEEVRRELRDLNWLFARAGDDFGESVARLVDALETDLEWLDAHTRLLKRAREWETASGDGSFLLRGTDLAAAERWLGAQGGHGEEATPLQMRYVLASHRASMRRQRMTLGAVLLALLVTAALAAVALVLRGRAVDREVLALSRERAASAVSQLTTDPELSVLLAREAIEVRSTPEAVDALRRALMTSRVRAVLRHPGPVRSAELSRDGALVVTAGADGRARLWRSTGGRPLAVLRHGGRVNSAKLSEDGKLAVTAGDDGTAAVWRVPGGQRVTTLRHGGPVRTAAFDRVAGRVLTASRDGTARVWRVPDGRELAVIRTPGPLQLAAFSPDGRFAVVAGERSPPRLWSGATGRVIRTLPVRLTTGVEFSRDGALLVTANGENAVVYRVPSGEEVSFQRTLNVLGNVVAAALSPDAKLVATANDAGTALLWRTAEGSNEAYPGWSMHLEAPGVSTVSFSDDGRLVGAAGTDGTARWWTVGGDPVAIVRHAAPVATAAFARDGRRLVTASADGTAVVWATGDPVAGPPLSARWPVGFNAPTHALLVPGGDVLRIVDFRTGAVRATIDNDRGGGAAELSPDGRFVLAQGSDGVADVFDAATGRKLGTLGDAAANTSHSWSFGGGGKVVVRVRSGGDGTTSAGVFSLPTGRRIASLEGLRDAAAVSVSPDAARLVTEHPDGAARLRRTSGGGVIAVLRHGRRVDDASFSARGSFVVTSGGGATRLWDATTGQPVLRVPGPLRATSPDERHVVTLTGERERIWRVPGGDEVKAVRGGSVGFASLFGPDGTTLATGGTSVRLWSVPDGRLLVTLPGAGASDPAPAAFSRDGRLLLTSSFAGPAGVWDVETGSLVAVPPRFLAGWTPDFRWFVGSDVDGGPRRSFRCDACLPLPELLRLAETRSPRALTAAEREHFLHEAD